MSGGSRILRLRQLRDVSYSCVAQVLVGVLRGGVYVGIGFVAIDSTLRLHAGRNEQVR